MSDSDESLSVSDEGAGSSVATLDSSASRTTVPRVIKFAYQGFTASGGKWRAKCTSCQQTLVSTPGVTTK